MRRARVEGALRSLKSEASKIAFHTRQCSWDLLPAWNAALGSHGCWISLLSFFISTDTSSRTIFRSISKREHSRRCPSLTNKKSKHTCCRSQTNIKMSYTMFFIFFYGDLASLTACFCYSIITPMNVVEFCFSRYEFLTVMPQTCLENYLFLLKGAQTCISS